MRKFLASAMVIAMALSICAAVVALGGVNQDFILIAYGFAAVAILGWIGKLFFGRTVTWKHSPVHWPMLGFFVYALIRYFTSPIEYESRLEVLNVGFYTIVYFLCAANFYHTRDRVYLLAALMILALGEAGYGIWQFWARPNSILLFSRPDEYIGRASGTYICPNHYAGFMEVVLALLVARLALWNPSKSSMQKVALQKVIIAYVGLGTLCGLMLSLSRSAWVATTLGLATFLLWGEIEWRRLWPRLAVGAAALAALIIVAVNVDGVRYHIVATFKEPAGGKSLALSDTTIGDRTVLWRDTTRMIADNPVLGTGPATWQWYHPQYQPKEMQDYAMLAHNDILNVTADYGLLGFLLIAFALAGFYRHVSAFMGAGNTSDRRSFAIGTAVAVTIMLIHSWFDFNMHIPANALLLAALLGFAVAMEDGGGRYPRVELSRWSRNCLGVGLLLVLGIGGWHAGRTAIAYYHQTEGKRHKSNMNWPDALASYNRSISMDPKAPVPHARIGDIYRTQAFWRVDPARRNERHELAHLAGAAYRRSLASNPRQVEVWLNLAKSLDLAGDRAAAEDAYLKAIALSPTTAHLHEQLALFYRHHGDEQRARQQFEHCLALAWNEVAALNLQELQSRQAVP